MNPFESRSVSYKEALSREAWPRINKYLAGLVRAKERGEQVNVAQYLRYIHLANKAKRSRQDDQRRKIFEAEAEIMRLLREKGFTCDEIGKILGVAAGTVSVYAPGFPRGHADSCDGKVME